MAGIGLNTFIHCEFGSETVYGTAVPPTIAMSGLTTGAHELMVTNEYPRTYQGDLAVVHDRVQVGKIGDLDLQGLAGFENLVWFLNMTMKKAAASADSGTPTPATTWLWEPALTAPDTPQSYSIDLGDNAWNWRYRGCLGRELRVSAEVDGLTEFAFTGFSKARAAIAQVPDLPVVSLETLPANFWKVYIDPAGATIGTTLYLGCLRGFNLTLSGFGPSKCMDGTYELTRVVQLGQEATLEMTVVADDAAIALITAYHEVATASALIRLEQLGTVIHTAINKAMRFDGTWFLDTVSKYGSAEADNQNLLTLTWRARRLDDLLVSAQIINALVPLTVQPAMAQAPEGEPAAAPPPPEQQAA